MWDIIASIAGPVLGGLLGNEASGTAANAQTQAANTAANTQLQMFNQNRADLAPWREAGVNALGQISQGTQPGGEFLRPFSMDDYAADPGYNFRMDQGMKAIQQSAAGKGNLLSGGALKGIQRFGQDLASQEYGNAYNRFNQNQANQFNRLASISGLGQTTAQQTGALGSAAAQGIAGAQMGAGNAQAAGAIGGANALAGGLAGASNAYLGQQYLNALTRGTSYGYGPMGYQGAYNNDVAQFGLPYGG